MSLINDLLESGREKRFLLWMICHRLEESPAWAEFETRLIPNRCREMCGTICEVADNPGGGRGIGYAQYLPPQMLPRSFVRMRERTGPHVVCRRRYPYSLIHFRTPQASTAVALLYSDHYQIPPEETPDE